MLCTREAGDGFVKFEMAFIVWKFFLISSVSPVMFISSGIR
jgi:hypothetical protein